MECLNCCSEWCCCCSRCCSVRGFTLTICGLTSFIGVALLLVYHKVAVSSGAVHLGGILAAVFQVSVGAFGFHAAWKRDAQLVRIFFYIVLGTFAFELLNGSLVLINFEMTIQSVMDDACNQSSESARSHCKDLLWSFRGPSMWIKWAGDVVFIVFLNVIFLGVLKELRNQLEAKNESEDESDKSLASPSKLSARCSAILSGFLCVLGCLMLITIKFGVFDYSPIQFLAIISAMVQIGIGIFGLCASSKGDEKGMQTLTSLLAAAITTEVVISMLVICLHEWVMQQLVEHACGRGSGRCEQVFRAMRQTKAYFIWAALISASLVLKACFMQMLDDGSFCPESPEESEKQVVGEPIAGATPSETTPLMGSNKS